MRRSDLILSQDAAPAARIAPVLAAATHHESQLYDRKHRFIVGNHAVSLVSSAFLVISEAPGVPARR